MRDGGGGECVVEGIECIHDGILEDGCDDGGLGAQEGKRQDKKREEKSLMELLDLDGGGVRGLGMESR